MPSAIELSVTEAAQKIGQREISPVDLVESLLAHIEVLEPALKAWVYLDREAVLSDARGKAAELQSRGNKGLLHGVPIGLKDIFYTAGIPTTACSKVYANFVPDYDATTVKLLKQAGAIILGKTVTTEFACMDPSPTINPWNPAHTPGGSSSGSAVAVASGMCPAAMGSQTVGSVLRPASYNGVVGFKPSFGLVSRYGVIPVSWTLDTIGWMTRSVEDAALLLQVMAGYDPKDMVSRREPVSDYLSGLHNAQPPRIGLLRDFFYENADSQTINNIDSIVKRLSDAGATIEVLPMPASIKTSIEDQQIIMAVEGASFHQVMFDKQALDYQPRLREMIQRGLDTDAVTYSRAMERRRQFVTDMRLLAEQADILLTPSTPQPAQPDVTNTGSRLFQGPWTSCGLPTITLPSGLSESGLPLGMQMAGQYLGEASLLATAKWCEQTLNIRLSPPV